MAGDVARLIAALERGSQRRRFSGQPEGALGTRSGRASGADWALVSDEIGRVFHV